MGHNMEWYRVFYWTARLGGLTIAAKKLNITQPAVSHTLKQLESALGTLLFIRTPRGVTLTSEGEVLYDYIKQAFHFIELGEKKMAEMHNLQHGEINIGASDTLCKHYLLPYLEQFHRQYPDIRIRVANRTTPETISLLKEGEIDFGIINLPAIDARLDIKQSFVQQDCLVASPKFAELAKRAFPLALLNEHPLLLLEPGGSTRTYLDAYAASHGVLLNPEFELGSIDLLVQFAVGGFGLTFMVRDYVADELATGSLVEIPLYPAVPQRHIGIATLKDTPLSAASRRFFHFLLSDTVQ